MHPDGRIITEDYTTEKDRAALMWRVKATIYLNAGDTSGWWNCRIARVVGGSATNCTGTTTNMNTEIGFLTNEVLLNYQNFQTSGMVFKKSLFNDYGGFKPSIKLTFVYELLLRLTYNSVQIMTIPKIGYRHSNMREGSIFWNYKNGEYKLTQEEVGFWIDLAKKEYFFKEDRQIKFEPVEV
jgi:hypothetical protein